MKKILFLLTLVFNACYLNAQETIIQYLSGTDKDHTVQWDFMCSSGMNSGKWSSIAVPSCWEQQGFGTFNYYEDKENPDEQGWYKHRFKTPSAWRNKRIWLVFEGSMTDTEVRINGKLAGPVHQGAFYQFRYDITELVSLGNEHLLEVNVKKKSANNSVNRAERQADFWLFGGIFRPVYLEIVPETFIERVAVDAKANGTFGMQVFTKNTRKNQTIAIQLREINGKLVGQPFSVSAADSSYLQKNFQGVRLWNPEDPNLYEAVISIKEGKNTVHTIRQRFGFRTVEFRKQDGFYVNDVKIIMKGVCRHSQWPESGRTLSRDVHLQDIALIKDMNMNAVRMSHYPPDKKFLDLCDSLGLFVLDELTGWQKAYDTVVGRKLVKEMVLRDVNHPSIIIWDNGNEGGWNRALDADYSMYDPQQRFVMHPWEKFNGTETKHYPDFNYVTNAVLYGAEVFYPTEFMHGLFDGGHGAGLDDFWNEMMKHRGFAGGFLWALHDEGVVRTDKNNVIDVAGNQAPDGIVGPHREKEASYYTIKEIWSPIHIKTLSIPEKFDGYIQVENRYLYTNLRQCKFEWKMVKLPAAGDTGTTGRIIRKGVASSPGIAPGETGQLKITTPLDANADVLYLTAYDKKGALVFTWSWPIRQPEKIVERAVRIPPKGDITATTNDNILTINVDGIEYRFNSVTGFMQEVFNGNKTVSLSGGPAFAGIDIELSGFKHYSEGGRYIVQPIYGDAKFYVKWIFENGRLPKLEYSFSQKGPADFMGITFRFPEEKITGMKWMGRGPYRVWKNRLKGQEFGVWDKPYNNTITGESWNYPEFKGWHSNMYWVQLQNREANFVVYTDQPGIFLQMLKPADPKGAKNDHTSPPFPDGNIGFMHAISPIGTKFQPAAVMGPQSQQNIQMNYALINGNLYFDFR